MLKGRLFKLNRPTLAVIAADGKRQTLRIPAGSVIKVVAEGSTAPNSLIGVLLDGRTLEMSAEDVKSRGREVLRSVNGVLRPLTSASSA
jgi:hypothetical protein